MQCSAESSTIGWIGGGHRRSVELGRRGEGRALLDAALDPHFVDPAVLPRREQAHAVTGRDDVLEVISHLRHRQIQVHILPHGEGGLHVERDLGDHAQRAEIDDAALKGVAVVGA